MKIFITAGFLLSLVAFGYLNSINKKPGREFSFAMCVAAYDKFNGGEGILEKLDYKDEAKLEYGKYSDNSFTVSLAIAEDKYTYNNYTLLRQLEIYYSCLHHS